jgi:hypothetical protein
LFSRATEVTLAGLGSGAPRVDRGNPTRRVILTESRRDRRLHAKFGHLQHVFGNTRTPQDYFFRLATDFFTDFFFFVAVFLTDDLALFSDKALADFFAFAFNCLPTFRNVGADLGI